MSEHPLKKFRGKHLKEIAKQLGVHKATIIRWESGEVLIPVSRLDAIERLTGIPREGLRPDIFAPETRQPVILSERHLDEEAE